MPDDARRLELYKDTAGEWRWRLVAGNGNVLADSGEGYKNRKDCAAIGESITGLPAQRARRKAKR